MSRNSPTLKTLRLTVMVASAAVFAPAPASAQSGKCAEEAAAIRRAETQLPRLDVAPPGDQQIVCITLETNILFARRLAAHVNQCPRSPHTGAAESWQRTDTLYTSLFGERRCKPAIRGYRG